MSRPLAWLPILPLVALAGAARAQTPPALEHVRVEKCERGQPLDLTAHVRAAAPATVFEPMVFVRPAGTAQYQQIPLLPAGGDLYQASISGTLTAAPFEYYIEAFDSEGNGPARAGLPKEPLRVEVVDPVPAPALPPPPPVLVQPGEKPANGVVIAGIALTAAGAAALIGGGVSTWLASVSLSEERQAAADGDAGRWDRAHADLGERRTSAWVLLSAGSAMAVTGALLWALAPSTQEEGPVRVAPVLGPQGPGIAVAGRF